MKKKVEQDLHTITDEIIGLCCSDDGINFLFEVIKSAILVLNFSI